MMLLASFVFCWTPYSIMYLWPLYDHPNNLSFLLTVLAPLFAKTAVVLTPSIFLYFDDDSVVKSD